MVNLKCIKSVSAFIEGNEYSAASKAFENELDKNDLQVLVVESSDGDIDTCYMIPLKDIYTYFKVIE